MTTGKTTENLTSKHEPTESATIHTEAGNQKFDKTRRPLMSSPKETAEVTLNKEVSFKENQVTSFPLNYNISGI